MRHEWAGAMTHWLENDTTKHLADVGSIGITVGAFAGWFPTISAGLAVVWMAIRIFETETVQRLLGRGDDARR